MKLSRLLMGTLALAGLAALTAGAANAQAVTPVFVSASASGGNFNFVYNIILGADTRIQAGNLLTFYDFNGLTGTPTFVATAPGASFAITTPFLGANPPLTLAPAGDSGAIANVSLNYNGISLDSGATTTTNLGTLSILSTAPATGTFTGFAANSTKISSGTAAGNQSFVTGPNAQISGTTPEPGTFALLIGMGLTGASIARRRLRRK